MVLSMPSINQVIGALRREIDAALDENAAPDSRIRLEPERIVLSLEFSMIEQRSADGFMELSFDVAEAAASPEKRKAHSLTFEFKPVSPLPSKGAIKSTPAQRKPNVTQPKRPQLDPAEQAEVVQSLSSVFGVPGFDSSARATVFCEVFAALSEAQVAKLIRSFSRGSIPDNDEVLRNARHRLSGVFRSGPLRSIERGPEILAEVLGRSALEALLLLIKVKWKTQADWLGH